MKKSFSFLEIILAILLLSFLYAIFIPKNKINYLDEITNKLVLYIKYIRYKAFIDNKFDSEDSLWFKKRWTLKFFRCRQNVGGIYFSIYSDRNNTGHPSIEDSLKDPLTNKNIYTSNYCEENNKNSKYVLLSKKFGIKDVQISCNETNSLGQLSFSSDGSVYSKLGIYENDAYEYKIDEPCTIKLVDNDDNYRKITIYPMTGYTKKE